MTIKKQTQSNKAEARIDEESLGLIVHAYNNFLSGSLGFAELAKFDCTQDNVEEKLDLSIDSSRQAVDFGNQLLSAVGRIQLPMQSINLLQTLEILEAELPLLTIQGQNELPNISILSDAEWFSRCCKIVISFIERFTQSKETKLTLSLEGKESVSMAFYNAELKFSADNKTHIFDLFYSSRQLLGTKDIGLAVARGFARQMQGQLTFCEERGFVMLLPIAAKA